MNDVRLRPMREADVPAVIAIEQRAYFSPWTASIFRDCLRVGYSCWLLEERHALAGYGVLSAAAGEAHLLNLCVAPECQSRGFGRLLLAHFIDVARSHRAETMFLEVRTSNTIAISLYETTGFNQVGSRRGYYPAAKGREDALIFALAL